MDYVVGDTVANGFSFRDRRALKSDPNAARVHWLALKNLDTAAPIRRCEGGMERAVAHINH